MLIRRSFFILLWSCFIIGITLFPASSFKSPSAYASSTLTLHYGKNNDCGALRGEGRTYASQNGYCPQQEKFAEEVVCGKFGISLQDFGGGWAGLTLQIHSYAGKILGIQYWIHWINQTTHEAGNQISTLHVPIPPNAQWKTQESIHTGSGQVVATVRYIAVFTAQPTFCLGEGFTTKQWIADNLGAPEQTSDAEFSTETDLLTAETPDSFPLDDNEDEVIAAS